MPKKEEEKVDINKSKLEQDYQKYFKYLSPNEKIIRPSKSETKKDIKTWVSHNTVMYQTD